MNPDDLDLYDSVEITAEAVQAAIQRHQEGPGPSRPAPGPKQERVSQEGAGPGESPSQVPNPGHPPPAVTRDSRRETPALRGGPTEICAHFALGEGASKLLRDGMTSREFLDVLLAGRQYADAVQFLARLLPKREGVWWACLCARQAHGQDPPPRIAAALQAAEKWAAHPGEADRRAAMAAAGAAGMNNPAAFAGLAAFWSDGSLGPPEVAPIPPGEYLAAQGVAGSVLLAAVLTEPEKAAEKYHQFLTQGIAVADGTNRWNEPRSTR